MNLFSRISIIALTALTLPLFESKSTRGDDFDLSFISQEAIAAVVVHPNALMRSPEFQLLPVEVFSAVGIRDFGIDPRQITQLVIIAEPPAGPGPPNVGFILRFRNDYNRTLVFPKILKSSETKKAGDKSYEQAADPSMPSIYFADGKTIVAAPEAMLRKLITTQPGDSPLRKLLADKGAEEHVNVLVSIDPVRPMLKAVLASLPPLPEPFGRFTKAADYVSSIEYRMNFAKELKSELTVNAVDADAAKELEELIGEGIEFGKLAIKAQMLQNLPANDDPVEFAMQEYMQRISNTLLNSLKPEREDDVLTISLASQSNVATIGVLTALLLPAVQAAREAARRAQSMNNMKAITIAFLNHENAQKRYPDRANYDANGKALLSWRVHILPYLDQQALYDQFHLDEPWDSKHNKTLIQFMPQIYRNPNGNAGLTTNYLVPVGDKTVFEKKESLKIRDIIDGTSNTVVLVEANDDQGMIWTKPGDLDFDADNPLRGLGNVRPGIFLAAFADGSVKVIANSIDQKVLRGLFTANGREVGRLD